MAGKEMTVTEARDFLARALWGRLATNGPDGPYITPLHHVLEGDTIYFHCALRRGRKLDNLNHDNRVCFEVSEMLEINEHANPCKFITSYKSVLAFGTVELIDDSKEKARVLNLLAGKYSSTGAYEPVTEEQGGSVAVLALKVERISGKIA